LVRILSKFSCHTVGKKEYGYKWTWWTIQHYT
jgi:hypothetical protein